MKRVHRLFLVLILFAATLNAQTWQDLLDGNQRFRDLKNPLVFKGLVPLRLRLADQGQNPRVTVVACADSRVPPELLFDQSLGRLFVVRVAGNIASTFDIASIEYAIARGYTRTIVVVGHEKCGAVDAALSKADPGTPALRELVERIRESFVVYKPQNLEEATKGNAKFTVDYLQKNSDLIRDAVKDKKVEIFAAYYDMASGRVWKLP